MPESCQSNAPEDSVPSDAQQSMTDSDRQQRRRHNSALQQVDGTRFLHKTTQNVIHKLTRKLPKTPRNPMKSESPRKFDFETRRRESSRGSPKKNSSSVESQTLAQKLSRDEKRRRRRATEKYRTAHASRERIRVEAFNVAFSRLRQLLPTLPPDKKLSKIEVLRLAICYISYLDHVLQMPWHNQCHKLHFVKTVFNISRHFVYLISYLFFFFFSMFHSCVPTLFLSFLSFYACP